MICLPLRLDLALGAIVRTTSDAMVTVVPRAATSSLYTESYGGDKPEGQNHASITVPSKKILIHGTDMAGRNWMISSVNNLASSSIYRPLNPKQSMIHNSS